MEPYALREYYLSLLNTELNRRFAIEVLGYKPGAVYKTYSPLGNAEFEGYTHPSIAGVVDINGLPKVLTVLTREDAADILVRFRTSVNVDFYRNLQQVTAEQEQVKITLLGRISQLEGENERLKTRTERAETSNKVPVLQAAVDRLAAEKELMSQQLKNREASNQDRLTKLADAQLQVCNLEKQLCIRKEALDRAEADARLNRDELLKIFDAARWMWNDPHLTPQYEIGDRIVTKGLGLLKKHIDELRNHARCSLTAEQIKKLASTAAEQVGLFIRSREGYRVSLEKSIETAIRQII